MLFTPLVLLLLPVSDETLAPCRPCDHAPAGLMDVRCPMDRDWMFSVRTTYTHFDGLRDNSQKVTTQDALGMGYEQVPTSMSMTMTMLELMYAPSQTLTFNASLPWLWNSMEMKTNLGESFKMSSEGIGDFAFGTDIVVWSLGEQTVSTGVSLSVPTGSITESGGMPGAPATRLEYAMQLGSGTYDISPRLDWRMRTDPYSYGIELSGTTRTGHNDEGYALGDRFCASAWGAQEWSADWSTSLRITAQRWANVRGADPLLDPMMSPTNDPHLQAGQRVDGAIGVNWRPLRGNYSGSVVGLEIGAPLAQDLDGPQLSEDWFAALNLGLSF